MPEFVRRISPECDLRAAVIDFDGTLSLFRSGWVEIMVEQMLNILRALPGTAESTAELENYITNSVLNFNGQPTILQMDYLVAEIRQRGGNPMSAEFYKQQVLNSLYETTERRMQSLATGSLVADDLMVPGHC